MKRFDSKKATLLFLSLLLTSMHFLHAQQISIYADTQFLSIFGQRIDSYNVLDTAKIVVTYRVIIVNDVGNRGDKVEDIQILEIGDRFSKTYSKLRFEADSIYTSLRSRGAHATPSFRKNISSFVVYNHLPSQHLTVLHRLFGSPGVYYYIEPIPAINWQITNERKRILSYNSQKAVGTFRGRTYEAWFTPDIPIQIGPYKFGGLPGLILAIRDTQNHYVFTAISVERPTNVVPITFWRWRGRRVPREEFLEIVRQAHSNPFQHLKERGWALRYIEGEEGDPRNHSFPFNPIELE